MKSDPTDIPILPGMAALAGRADAWLVDIWGVMHNGVRAFPAACEAGARFREGGGVVVLVTNAPRPFHSVVRQLEGLGVPETAYDGIITSGDVTRELIRAESGRPLFHLGPERDKPVFQGLEANLVPARAAEVVVCTGLFDDTTETPETYAAALTDFRDRGLPMICANPDLTVERGDRIVYCAGALAQAYERIGGRVEYAGKPYRPIYSQAFAMVDRLLGRAVPKARVLAIGDGVRTDMAGAHAAGLDMVFIPSGIHLSEGAGAAEITALFRGLPFRPMAALAGGLAW